MKNVKKVRNMEISFKFYVPFVVIMLFKRGNPAERNIYMQSTSNFLNVISELPSQTDLQIYLSALKSLISYVSLNKQCVNFGMKFGLFLLDVNLRPFLNDDRLPISLRKDLTFLTEKSKKLHDIYNTELLHKNPPDLEKSNYNLTEMYVSMLTNDSLWSTRILKLDLDLLKEVYSYSYQFPEWNIYLNEVDDLVKWMPNIDVSNRCLSMLSKNQRKTTEEFPQCLLAQDCLEMLDNGTKFGYALSFRLLFLLLARLSCKCAVFSIHQDQRIRHYLCKDAYRESEYIADNNFQKVDVMIEHITLCTLDGHAQFLRKSWLSAFLELQTPYGYFSGAIGSNKQQQTEHKSENSNDYTIKDDTCLEHINAAIVGTLAAAIRFILENL